MIDPARTLSLCHPIATIFITLLLASPALPLRPHRRRWRSTRRLYPPPCCAFFAVSQSKSPTHLLKFLDC
jgi:hypothetical protein